MLFARRKKFSRADAKLGKAFAKLGLSPNQWTLVALILAFVCAYALAQRAFLPAAVLFAIVAVVDKIDGAVAKATDRATKTGAYIDTVADRYVEAIIIVGLFFASLPNAFLPSALWLLLYLFGSLATTYARAASRVELGVDAKGGLLERAERMIILFVGIILAVFSPVYLTYVVILLAVLSNITALQRINKALRA